MLKNLRNSEKLRLLLLSIFMGIFLGRNLFFLNYILFIGGLFFIFSLLFKNWIFLLFSVFFLANSWGQFYNTKTFQPSELNSFNNELVEIEGFVSGFPSDKDSKKAIKITVEKITLKSQAFTQKNMGNLLLEIPKKSEIDYGDTIYFKGKLSKPRNFGNFDYATFLKRLGISMLVRNPQDLKLLEKGTKGKIPILWAKKLRNKFSQNLQSVLPKAHAQIAEGILLGVKSKLPKSIEKNFKNAGLQHILVVSGFNVSVLMVFVAFFLKQFGRKIVFLGSIFLLIFFVLMVGFEPSILRAAVFGGMLSVAVLMGKFSDSRNLLFLSAVVLGIFSPTMIQYDIGFFLSFSATFGIILGVPIFEKIPIKSEMKTILAVIISAQLAVSPILGIYFEQFPVAGFLSNLLVEPLIPLAMVFSFMSGLLGFVSTSISALLAIPSLVVIDIIFWIAQVFGTYEPLLISQNFSLFLGFFVWSFFLWGSFSRYFQRIFLEKADLKFDFLGQKQENV